MSTGTFYSGDSGEALKYDGE